MTHPTQQEWSHARFERVFASKTLDFPGIKSAKKSPFWPLLARSESGDLGRTRHTKSAHAPRFGAFRPKHAFFVSFCPQTSHLAQVGTFPTLSRRDQKSHFFHFFHHLGSQRGAQKRPSPKFHRGQAGQNGPPLPRRKISARGVCFAPPLQSIYLSFSADLK